MWVLGVPPTYRQPYPLDDEHEGVEAYDNKFFTFTGNRLNANPDDDIEEGSAVADAGEWVDEWLAEAYKAIEGPTPGSSPTPLTRPIATSKRVSPGRGRNQPSRVARITGGARTVAASCSDAEM